MLERWAAHLVFHESNEWRDDECNFAAAGGHAAGNERRQLVPEKHGA
jgi:hypothetical protein